MIQIKDLDTAWTVFTEIEKLSPDLRMFTVFGTGAEIDDIYTYEYGYRYVTDDFDSPQAAKRLDKLYAASWDMAYYLFASTDNIIPDLGQQSEKITLTEHRYTDTTAVAAYDDTELATDSTVTHDEITGDNINKVTVTDNKKDIRDFTASFEYLRLNWLDDIIFNDVNRFVTLYTHNL